MALRGSGQVNGGVDVCCRLLLLNGITATAMGTREELLRRSGALINLFVMRD